MDMFNLKSKDRMRVHCCVNLYAMWARIRTLEISIQISDLSTGLVILLDAMQRKILELDRMAKAAKGM